MNYCAFLCSVPYSAGLGAQLYKPPPNVHAPYMVFASLFITAIDILILLLELLAKAISLNGIFTVYVILFSMLLLAFETVT